MNKEIRKVLERFVSACKGNDLAMDMEALVIDAEKLLAEPVLDCYIPEWLDKNTLDRAYELWQDKKIDGVKLLNNISKTMGTHDISKSNYFGLKEAMNVLHAMDNKRFNEMQDE